MQSTRLSRLPVNFAEHSEAATTATYAEFSHDWSAPPGPPLRATTATLRAMFQCTECPKDFNSQSALARHHQNHSQSIKHVCNVCSVVFRRRDLLTRHLKLHYRKKNENKDNVSNDTGGESGTGGEKDGEIMREANTTAITPENTSSTSTGGTTGTVSRKRCHTACNRCRDMKIKCNGQQPCSRCRRVSKTCDFDRQHRLSGRISHLHSIAVAKSSSSDSVNACPDLGFTSDPMDASHIPIPDFSPASFTNIGADPGAITSSTLIDGRDEFVSDPILGIPYNPWEATFSQFTPWPWLHESLFLSGDEAAILFSDLGQDPTFPEEQLPDLHRLATQTSAMQSSDHDQNNDQDQSLSESHYQQHNNQSNPHSGQSLDATSSAAPGYTANIDVTSRENLLPLHENSCTQLPNNDNGCKQRAVDALIALAVQPVERTVEKPGTYRGYSCPWSKDSQGLVDCFHIKLESDDGQVKTTTEAALKHFTQLYAEHFHTLWPLLPRRTLDSGNMHPLLYLVLASIGAMYMDGSSSECGMYLHDAVRRRLVLPLELDENEDDLVWLAQARLLTQVAALYFGQPRAFSYAQHLGTLLTTQARRMSLFCNTNHRQRLLQLKSMKGIATDSLRLNLWLSIEERRRLAFGIFRGDTFTSVLLNTKPLVALEEIALEFPTCHSVFNSSSNLDPRLALDMIEHHQTPNQNVRASDVLHVLLERNEILPPLEPGALEILLFGLQSHVWRFSYDRQLLEHLTAGVSTDVDLGIGLEKMQEEENITSVQGLECDFLDPPFKKHRRDTITSEVDSLDNRSYEMADLTSERQRLLAALAKWERALPLAKTLARNEEDRSYLLSSLILYHLSLMRLYAPVEDIHQIHYRLADKQPVPNDLVMSVRTWSQSTRARIAVEKVRSVWSLITQETRRGRGRSRFNFNAYIGLHHSAAMLWVYQGATNSEQMDDSLSAFSTSGSLQMYQGENLSPTFPMYAEKAEDKVMLRTFVDLFHAMSPARWSSFAEVANDLPTLAFPPRVT
ncbi:hypothetical protein OPT61_g1247 [Boeremia exigua]|uniref:Uncharacterized protein n=1 Tax=Boeremia exigua TaxID=749465 RepID=A0ACC2IQV8_9PLEO|nr:hypothetical protein OPT61_g1247 [Boeremia exigua]